MSIWAHFKRGMVFFADEQRACASQPLWGPNSAKADRQEPESSVPCFQGLAKGGGATSLSAGGLGEAEGLVQVNDLSVQKCRDENPHKVWHIIKRRFRRKRLDDKDHDHD